jgi:serine/threonine protein kinase/tetratricopeptide (TPR) repeat protein
MPPPSVASCPSDDELVQLIEGRLDGPALARLREHVAGCRGCAGLVAGLGSRAGVVRPSTSRVDVEWARNVVAEAMQGRMLAPGGFVPAGARIAGRFVIVSHAGSGGMGTVYRALDEQTGGMVALKLLQRRDDPEGAERFAREARVLSELQHPGIVAYLAHGETETGAPYLAMEWLDGEDLARRLARGPLPIAEALVLLRRAAEALAMAHARGLVHRDLKPHNLFLRGGQVERLALLDFGVARRDAASQVVTGTGVIVGTPAYMAPEQARGEQPVHAAADVFSLGCVMFECITGRPPFQAEQLMAVLAKILFEEPPRLHRVCPGAPEAVDALLSRMLAKSAENRFKDASALIAALDALDEVRPMPNAPPPAASGEQQLLSVLMATPPAAPPSSDSTITLPFDGHDLRDLEDGGARFEVLADGSIVATLLHKGSAATDQAAEAARCAMRIKARWPGATIALGTGSGLLHDRAVAGEAFDRAAALLRGHAGQAGSDRIMVDEATRGLLEVRYVTERAPSGVYVLTGEELSLDATRPLLGKPTPCVGRDAELALLEASLSACIEEEEPRAVLVKAPPGVGKSRLRHELVRRISTRGEGVSIVIGRGDPLSAGTSYGLFGQAIRRLSGILDGEGIETRREKLARRVGERLPEEARARVITFLGELSGVPFPDEHDMRLRAARQDPLLMSDQITLAALDFLRAECAAHPMLLVLEDLHWGDALTVKLCGTALRKLSGCPLMVLAIARPEVDELFPEVWSGVAQVVILSPLSRKAGERLVRQVLGREASPETVARIVAQSEGNALFLEELIRAAAEGSGDEASGTVLAMMQARIGRLPASARRVLRAASVFGETAGQGGIHALLGGAMSDREIDGWIALLLREEILEERSESRFPGEKAYRFHHALVRDAAYSLSLEEERVLLHRLAGEYLEARGELDSLVMAEHFVLGGEPLRAAPHYRRAGEESYEANDLPAALSSAGRGLASGAEGELRGALLSLTVSVSLWRDELAEVIALGTEAIDLLPSGSKHWCRSCRSVCVAATLGDRPAVIAELTPRFARAEPSPDARFEYVQGATWFAIMLAIAGRKEESRAFQKRARQIGAAVSRDDLLTWGYLLAMEAVDRILVERLPWSSFSRFREGADALETLGEQSYQMVLRANLGKDLYDLGDLPGAEAELRRTLARAERLGERLSMTYARVFLAQLLAQTAPPDRFDEAERIAREVIAAKNASLMGAAYAALAEILRRQGDLAGAERETRAGQEVARPFPSYAAEVTALRASILLEQGRAEEALAVAEAGVREQERLGLEGYAEIELRLSLAEALDAAGRTDAARAALRETILRLKKRLDDIPEPAARRRYLTNVRINARVVALAEAWLGDEAVRALIA